MNNFKELKKLGDGSFGSVIKALNLTTNEIVAIKRMKQKYSSWEECINLKEIKALRKLNHVNTIKLKEVVLVNNELNLFFEYIEKNLLQYYSSIKEQGSQINQKCIKSLVYQIANGLSYMHKHGYFHRDLKPENLLINQ